MSETANLRFKKTRSFIEANETQIAKQLDNWKKDANFGERHSILEAMSLGRVHLSGARSQGDGGARQELRALVLIRTAILRHEVSKVKAEVGMIHTSSVAKSKLQDVIRAVKQRASSLDHEPAQLKIWRLREEERACERRDQNVLRFRQKYESSVEALEQATQAQPDVKLFWTPHPDPKDGEMTKSIQKLSNGGMSRTAGSLTLLRSGGELFVVGHGHMGESIGSSSGSNGARSLTTVMRNNGLPFSPEHPIWIYLWMCWGGTYTRRGIGGIGKREPYARRLARAMAGSGFKNYYVVGFAGSVTESNIQQDMYYGGDRKGFKHKTIDHHEEEAYVVYHVSQGDYNRVEGQDWTTKFSHSGVSRKGWRRHITVT
jgi:hypothetical protein